MEVDYYEEDSYGGHEVHQVREVLSVEGLTEPSYFVSTCSQEMEECNDCSLELCTFTSVDSGGREGLPYDGLTDVSGNE